MKNSDHSTKNFLIGAAVGGLLGALVGLLSAPKSGCELRQDLQDSYDGVTDKAHELVSNAEKKGKSLFKKAQRKKNKWLDMAHDVADEISEKVEDVEHIADSAKDIIDEALEWATIGYRFWRELKNRR